MLQAMNTGHDGSICTVHSNGPRDTLARVETMVLMAGMDLPVRAIREQVASAVDVIVHQARFRDGSRHITHVTEVERMEGEVITLQDIFAYDHSSGFDETGRSMGSLKATGLRPKFLEKMSHANVNVDPMLLRQGRVLMRRTSLGLASALLALFPVLLLPAAHADDTELTIGHVQPAGDDVQILVSVPKGADVDLDGIAVSIDGDEATSEAAPTGEDTENQVRRTTILAIDTSDSMKGVRFDAAKVAAETFLENVPDDVYVGIVTFDAEVKTALVPSLDRDAATEVVEGLALARGHPAQRRRHLRRDSGRHRRAAKHPRPVGRTQHQQDPAG